MIYGYIRVSTQKQDVESQRLSIFDYANRNKMNIDKFIEIVISSRRTTKERKVDELLSRLKMNDTLIVSELSRLGRSVGQLATITDELVKNRIHFIAIKEGIDIAANGKKDIKTTAQIGTFSMLAEIERQLISERTKEGLAAAKAKGKQLGRRKGSFSQKLLDSEQMIKDELKYGVAVAAIARKLGISRGSLINFMEQKGLKKGKPEQKTQPLPKQRPQTEITSECDAFKKGWDLAYDQCKDCQRDYPAEYQACKIAVLAIENADGTKANRQEN